MRFSFLGSSFLHCFTKCIFWLTVIDPKTYFCESFENPPTRYVKYSNMQNWPNSNFANKLHHINFVKVLSKVSSKSFKLYHFCLQSIQFEKIKVFIFFVGIV